MSTIPPTDHETFNINYLSMEAGGRSLSTILHNTQQTLDIDHLASEAGGQSMLSIPVEQVATHNAEGPILSLYMPTLTCTKHRIK